MYTHTYVRSVTNACDESSHACIIPKIILIAPLKRAFYIAITFLLRSVLTSQRSRDTRNARAIQYHRNSIVLCFRCERMLRLSRRENNFATCDLILNVEPVGLVCSAPFETLFKKIIKNKSFKMYKKTRIKLYKLKLYT